MMNYIYNCLHLGGWWAPSPDPSPSGWGWSTMSRRPFAWKVSSEPPPQFPHWPWPSSSPCGSSCLWWPLVSRKQHFFHSILARFVVSCRFPLCDVQQLLKFVEVDLLPMNCCSKISDTGSFEAWDGKGKLTGNWGIDSVIQQSVDHTAQLRHWILAGAGECVTLQVTSLTSFQFSL